MYTIRDLVIEDVPETVRTCSMLATKYYPELRFNYEQAKKTLWGLMCAKDRHYLRAAVDSMGTWRGFLLAYTADNIWAERKHCSVLVWHATKGGAGMALLRDFKKWIMPKRFIRVAGFQLDCNVDFRVYRLLQRAGFAGRGEIVTLFN